MKQRQRDCVRPLDLDELARKRRLLELVQADLDDILTLNVGGSHLLGIRRRLLCLSGADVSAIPRGEAVHPSHAPIDVGSVASQWNHIGAVQPHLLAYLPGCSDSGVLPRLDDPPNDSI